MSHLPYLERWARNIISAADVAARLQPDRHTFFHLKFFSRSTEIIFAQSQQMATWEHRECRAFDADVNEVDTRPQTERCRRQRVPTILCRRVRRCENRAGNRSCVVRSLAKGLVQMAAESRRGKTRSRSPSLPRAPFFPIALFCCACVFSGSFPMMTRRRLAHTIFVGESSLSALESPSVPISAQLGPIKG